MHVYQKFRHPGINTGEGSRTLKTLCLKQRRIPVPSLLHKVPLVRIELTMDLSPARVLSPAHIPVLLQRHVSTPGEIRTLTEPGLNRRPLPVGIRELITRYVRVSRARDGPGRAHDVQWTSALRRPERSGDLEPSVFLV